MCVLIVRQMEALFSHLKQGVFWGCPFSQSPFITVFLTCKDQGTHTTEKTGKMAKKYPCQGKHREFGNFAKRQGKHREFAQVVSSLILKVKDISVFAVKISIFSEDLDKAVLCM